jgi:hypothetical protein
LWSNEASVGLIALTSTSISLRAAWLMPIDLSGRLDGFLGVYWIVGDPLSRDGGSVSTLFSPSRREMDYCSVLSYKTDVLKVSRVARWEVLTLMELFIYYQQKWRDSRAKRHPQPTTQCCYSRHDWSKHLTKPDSFGYASARIQDGFPHSPMKAKTLILTAAFNSKPQHWLSR